MANNATTLLNVGRTYTVTRYIERLGDLVNEHEGLAIVHGWVSFVTGRFAEAERALAVAARLDTEGLDAGLILSLSAMVHLAKGDVAGGLAAIEEQVPTTEPTHPMVLGGVRVMGGLFDEARPFLDQAKEMAARPARLLRGGSRTDLRGNRRTRERPTRGRQRTCRDVDLVR